MYKRHTAFAVAAQDSFPSLIEFALDHCMLKGHGLGKMLSQQRGQDMSMNGQMLFCGDLHGQFRHIVKAATELQDASIILLGDMEPQRPLHVELEQFLDRIWFIHGNHDTDSDQNWVNVWESQLAERNIHGRVVQLPNGIRVGGLGGVFRGSVWHPGRPPIFRNREEHAKETPSQARWRDSVHRKQWSTIYPDELGQLVGIKADILITHEAPGYHSNGFEILDDLAQCMGAKVTVHGHQHDHLDSSARWAIQGFKSFGVGLRGITAIDVDGNAKVIVPGELDVQRGYRQKYIDSDDH